MNNFKYDGRSRPTNEQYKNNYDAIFGKKEEAVIEVKEDNGRDNNYHYNSDTERKHKDTAAVEHFVNGKWRSSNHC